MHSYVKRDPAKNICFITNSWVYFRLRLPRHSAYITSIYIKPAPNNLPRFHEPRSCVVWQAKWLVSEADDHAEATATLVEGTERGEPSFILAEQLRWGKPLRNRTNENEPVHEWQRSLQDNYEISERGHVWKHQQHQLWGRYADLLGLWENINDAVTRAPI